MGTQWNFATLSLQFDEELYVPDMILAPLMEQACPAAPSCTPCDWRSASATSCALTCCGATNASLLSQWCQPTLPFTSLELNQVSEVISVDNGGWQYFRFFLGPDTWCSPIRVKIRLHSGQADSFLSQVFPYPTAEQSELRAITKYGRNHQSLTMAPWLDDTIGLGTVALAVFGRTTAYFTVEIVVAELQIPLPAPALDAAACLDIPDNLYPSDHLAEATELLCLQDSVTTTFPTRDAGTQYQLVFSVPPGCHTYGLVAYPLQRDELGTDVDLYCVPVQSNVSIIYANAIFASYTVGADYLVFSTCSDSRVWIRCGADLYAAGPVSFFFSTVAPTMLNPLTQLDAYDYTTFAAKNSMAVTTAGFQDLSSVQCADWNSGGCDFFWPTFPAQDPRPFWPPPDGVVADHEYNNIEPFDDLLLPSMHTAVSGLYVMTIVLNSPLGQFATSAKELFATNPNLVLFAANVVNRDGEAVQLPGQTSVALEPTANDLVTPYFPFLVLASLPEPIAPCSSADFIEVLGATSPLIDSLATTDEVFVTRFHIDTFTATFAYSACYEAVLSLLVFNQTNITTNTQHCPYNPGDPEWNSDPCCNENQLTLSCCGAMPLETTVKVYFDDPTSAAVDAQCRSPACAHSFLSSFAQVVNQQQDPATACETPLASIDDIIIENKALVPLQLCRLESGLGINFDGIACATDLDCQSWPGALCSQRLQRCTNISLETMETMYLECFIASLDSFQIEWLKQSVLNVSGINASSAEFFQLLRTAASAPDCLGYSVFDLSQRSRYQTQIIDVACAQSVIQSEYGDNWTASDYEQWCGDELCLGASCLPPASNCYSYCASPTTYEEASETGCPAEDLCRFDSCASSTTFVCAYCPPDELIPCITVPGVSSETACQQAVVCELPDGSFRTDMTAEECAAITRCSTDCVGSSCRSERALEGACILTAATTASQCQSAGAAIGSQVRFQNNSTCIATNVTYQFECAALTVSSNWFSCASHSPCDRSTPAAQYLQCFTDIFTECTTSSDCASAGRCSDLDFIPRLINPQTLVASYGGCFSSGFYSSTYVNQAGQDPFCNIEEFEVRNGCLAPIDRISSAAQCSTSNSFYSLVATPTATAWITPALTEEACVSQIGCWESTMFLDRLSWRNSTECSECNGVSESFWTWQSGQWQAGAVRQPQWQATVTTANYYWHTDTLSFALTEDWIIGSMDAKLSSSLRSAALCNFELITSPLASLVCDCFDNQTSQCYAKAPVAVPEALGKACTGLNTTILFGFSSLAVAADDVTEGCIDLQLSKVDHNRYRATKPPPQVSFRLALPQADNTSPIKNQQGRAVGVLVGDGTQVQATPKGNLVETHLCLQVLTALEGLQYPVIDFGIGVDLHTIQPLGIEDMSRQSNSEGTLVAYCGTLKNADGLNGHLPTYFPIQREVDYQSGSGSTYSSTSEALIYTLGALYSICFIFIVLFTAAGFLWWWSTDNAHIFVPLSSLFFVFLCVFRLVYCFMAPSDVLTDDVANYAVFELPTFFYFTSFSIVLAIWFEALNLFKLGGKNQHLLSRLCLLLINIISYSLFIAVMIAVAIISAQPSETSSDCPGRVSGTETSKASDTRNLSLAYQSIVIALTFFFTVAFVYSLSVVVSRSRELGRDWQEVYSKSRSIINIALIVVIGFLTRCILFIIILALDFTSTIYMFITLTITEIFVILGVCSQFSIIKYATRTLSRSIISRSSSRSDPQSSS